MLMALRNGEAVSLIQITEPGTYDLVLENEQVQVHRVQGDTPVDVFVE